jgi:hypothetical protein
MGKTMLNDPLVLVVVDPTDVVVSNTVFTDILAPKPVPKTLILSPTFPPAGVRVIRGVTLNVTELLVSPAPALVVT